MLALRVSRSTVFVKHAMQYLKLQLNDMQIQEVAKVFFALSRKKGALDLTGNPKHDQDV